MEEFERAKMLPEEHFFKNILDGLLRRMKQLSRRLTLKDSVFPVFNVIPGKISAIQMDSKESEQLEESVLHKKRGRRDGNTKETSM